ncbi:hypothetical protein, partial [Gluconobacter japonicus]|uniref:hypothetical protein n=1 Tax=Gluconobacter japonicus TaxID=376620 RepID=UPI000AD2ED91
RKAQGLAAVLNALRQKPSHLPLRNHHILIIRLEQYCLLNIIEGKYIEYMIFYFKINNYNFY